MYNSLYPFNFFCLNCKLYVALAEILPFLFRFLIASVFTLNLKKELFFVIWVKFLELLCMLFHGSKKNHFRLPCFLLFTSFCIFVGVLER